MSVRTENDWTVLTVSPPEDMSAFIVSKGSVTIDGVSLTITECDGKNYSVALIPHTLKYTTLGTLHEGSMVNIETDILGRYIHSISSK